MDQREISLKSFEFIEKLTQNSEDRFLSTVKKLFEPKMLNSVEIGVRLVSRNIKKFKTSED